MLTDRRSALLNLIVEEYVDTALPVGSQYIVKKHQMAVSPATVRIEMARLEEEGFISQPHTSAGRVPSDKGYRYYVESLMSEEAIPWQERETIRHQFHQAERAMEQWFQLAAAVLAHSVSNFAVVTSPHSKETRLRHVQLVPLHELSALCVVVLNEARIRQQVLSFREPVDATSLLMAAGRINERYGGLTQSGLVKLPEPASELETLVVQAVADLMDQESVALGDVFRDGVREVLSQPEFARSERMLDIIDVLEQRTLPTAIPIRQLGDDGISVVIGTENSHESLQECSVVVARYGSDGGPSGVVAVLGPTRMRYSRTIPTVRYLAAVLSELIQQI
ncbi:MAG TPA: heat-inducible transcriptional repressor HrcA [Dehalococcoidia bacterium]|nr:heat-inducible transcriptional repressor HrcA [Dehalococcoidia bacterium]